MVKVDFGPDLYTGFIIEVFRMGGIYPVVRERLKRWTNGSRIIGAITFKSLFGLDSIGVQFGLNCPRSSYFDFQFGE